MAQSVLVRRALFATQLLAGTICASLVLAGCKSDDVTGSIGPLAAVPAGTGDLHHYSEEWGRRYEANPADRAAALNYARSLRALGQYSQAVAVMQNASIKHPTDMEVLGAYGKALADAGRLQEAAEILQRAHSPDRPNPDILSAQGSVADQLGEHEEARRLYQTALKITPNSAPILSNLGLSFALSKQLGEAETTLRQAAACPGADARVRQNLALVLALEGKFAEAQQVSQHDLSPADAAVNVAAIRAMISQSNTWRDIQKAGAKKPAGAG